VTIDGELHSSIETGLLALVGFQPGDEQDRCCKLLDRLFRYRVFSDADGKMNQSLRDIGGQLLLVPQFTLAADTSSGLRPGFSTAAKPADGRRLFDIICAHASTSDVRCGFGVFGADMQVALVNDGPVTFLLKTS